MCTCMLPLSIALRAIAEAWMSEFRDVPSLVCYMLPLNSSALWSPFVVSLQWAGHLEEFARVPARVLPRPAVR